MAVLASVVKGYDVNYAPSQVGGGPADYYLSAGEPPGRWYGLGAQALGYTNGQVIDHDQYKLLYGKRIDPRDGATVLGMRPGHAARDRAYHRLLAAEPHATELRKGQLRDEAARQTRESFLYHDVTFSLDKSISLFHASLGELARRATEDGDGTAAASWTRMLSDLDEAIHAAVG